VTATSQQKLCEKKEEVMFDEKMGKVAQGKKKKERKRKKKEKEKEKEKSVPLCS